jgi:hypothetical protein
MEFLESQCKSPRNHLIQPNDSALRQSMDTLSSSNATIPTLPLHQFDFTRLLPCVP